MKSQYFRKKQKWYSQKKFGKNSMMDIGVLVAQTATATKPTVMIAQA